MSKKYILKNYGLAYIFAVIIMFVSSTIYGNIGNTFIYELLENNLHYTIKYDYSRPTITFLCSIKNTGYKPINDLKILVYSTEPGIVLNSYDTILLKSEETSKNYLHNVFRMKEALYPDENIVIKFEILENNELPMAYTNDGNALSNIYIKIYSSNVPGILSNEITSNTDFEISPYLSDLLWVIAWTYIGIGFLIVAPTSIIVLTIFLFLSKLFRNKHVGMITPD